MLTIRQEHNTRPQIAISSCLLGENVRYDGESKRNAFIIDTLGERFELVPLCPEMAIGLGVPRAAIHLVSEDTTLRLCGVDDNRLDVTLPMQRHAAEIAQGFTQISGYLFKARSPSCGLRDTPVYNSDGETVRVGAGLYAGILTGFHPYLPVMDEELFMDSRVREEFFARVYDYHHQHLS